MKLDLSKIECIEFEDIDFDDRPDFCDAFISYAKYYGREMTEEELEWLNSYENNDFKYEKLNDYLY